MHEKKIAGIGMHLIYGSKYAQKIKAFLEC